MVIVREMLQAVALVGRKLCGLWRPHMLLSVLWILTKPYFC